MPSKEAWKRLAQNQAWREKNRAYMREYTNKTRREAREAAILHYGGKCKCCGEIRFEFLAIHHLNGGGNKHRKSLKLSGAEFCRWLKNRNWPEGYGILCHNCNGSHGFYRYCPHDKEREIASESRDPFFKLDHLPYTNSN